MKVLFFLGYPNPFPGAAWTRIGFLTEAWSKKGHSIDVLGTFSFNTLQKRGVKKIGDAKIFNIVFKLRRSNPAIFVLNSIISLISSFTFLLFKKPNVTIVSVPAGDVGLGAMMACKLLKFRYVIDYRDEWEDYTLSLTNTKMDKVLYSIIRKITTSLYAKSYLIVTVTINLMEALRKRGLNNVKLVQNGADVKTFKPIITMRENFTIIYTGVFGRYYKLDVVVKSLKKLVDWGIVNVEFVIAGFGDIDKVRNLATRLDISNKIKYEGMIDDKAELANIIAKADIGLIPYDNNPLWKNALPAKFFEYCACGVPVIASVYEDSILAELIKENEVGLTVPPMDEDKLADAIYWMYKNESNRKAMSKRARLLIEKKFDRNKIADELLDLVKISL